LQEHPARSVRENSIAEAAEKSGSGYHITERLYYKAYEGFYSDTSKWSQGGPHCIQKELGMDDFATRKGYR